MFGILRYRLPCQVFTIDPVFISQLFFQNKAVTEEEAFILFVRKNALQVLIPKYGLEGTVFTDKDATGVIYNEEVTFCFLCPLVSRFHTGFQSQYLDT